MGGNFDLESTISFFMVLFDHIPYKRQGENNETYETIKWEDLFIIFNGSSIESLHTL